MPVPSGLQHVNYQDVFTSNSIGGSMGDGSMTIYEDPRASATMVAQYNAVLFRYSGLF